jgi:TatD DNase family protein
MTEPIIDSHAHVHFDQLAEDMLGVLERAKAAGLATIVNVGTGPTENGRVAELAEREPMLWAAVGFHPHIAAEIKMVDWPALEDLARRPRVVGLGEFGLDLHYTHSPEAIQRDVFAQGIRLALAADKPLVIHSREADRQTLDTLDTAAGGRMPRGVLHCFTGGPDFAREVLARGFYVSFSGIVTFPSAPEVRESARITPMERLLIETDSPYCAPVPLRGRVNEPANVVHVARFLADLYGLSEDDVRRITTRNASHLFGLPLAAGEPCLVYPIRKSLYVNVTSECSNRCTFCPRSAIRPVGGGDLLVKGHDLYLSQAPSAAEIVRALEAAGVDRYDEVVFCGFGEPTMRLEVIKEVARTVKRRWTKRVRLNTNGHGSALAGRDIVPELAGLIDSVSVSLDAPDAATYEQICKPTFPGAFEAVCAFIRACKGHIPEIRATAVAVPGIDLDATRRLAEKELDVAFEVRAYNVVG